MSALGTIGSRFDQIAASVTHPVVPHLTLEQVTSLVGPAFTIALLAAVESLLSAVSADGMIGGQHRSNMELVAQGRRTSRRPCSAASRRRERSRARRRTSRTAGARRSRE